MEKMPSEQLVCLNGTRGTEDVVNNKLPGHSVTMKTGENMENMRIPVRLDDRLCIRMFAEELTMAK
jgi:hypothetical protein